MSIESFGSRNQSAESERTLVAKVEDLLDRLPPELQEFWETKLEGASIAEQVRRLTAVLETRNGTQKINLTEVGLLPKGVELYPEFPEDVKKQIEVIRTSKKRIEIGYGKAGHVIASRDNPELCFKLLLHEDKVPRETNDIAVETKLQQEVGQAFDGAHGVLVPRVFAFIDDGDARAIVMELLNAPSLRKVIHRKAELMPEAFDEEKFFAALEAFVKDMNAKGYYHGDLHYGNVLVHRETGMPCVIDFGLSKFDPMGEENAYIRQVVESGQTKQIVLKSDLDNLRILKRQTRSFLEETSSNNRSV